MENTLDVNVIQYLQQLKKESVNSIRLLEVDITRKFDEVIYIVQTMDDQLKSATPPTTEV